MEIPSVSAEDPWNRFLTDVGNIPVFFQKCIFTPSTSSPIQCNSPHGVEKLWCILQGSFVLWRSPPGKVTFVPLPHSRSMVPYRVYSDLNHIDLCQGIESRNGVRFWCVIAVVQTAPFMFLISDPLFPCGYPILPTLPHFHSLYKLIHVGRYPLFTGIQSWPIHCLWWGPGQMQKMSYFATSRKQLITLWHFFQHHKTWQGLGHKINNFMAWIPSIESLWRKLTFVLTGKCLTISSTLMQKNLYLGFIQNIFLSLQSSPHLLLQQSLNYLHHRCRAETQV